MQCEEVKEAVMKKHIIVVLIFCFLCFGGTVREVSAANSGTCGPSATWELDGGVLTISGSGAVTERPWHYKYTQIWEVEIGDEITEIPDSAFEGALMRRISIGSKLEKIGSQAFEATYLTEITIPESVKEIGEEAFVNCDLLQKVTLPKEVKRICKGTFSSCTKLTDINLEYICQIDKYAFYDCDRMEKVSFGSSLERISPKAFDECDRLKEVTFMGGKPNVHVKAFAWALALRKIVNHSESEIPVPPCDEIIWKQDKKKVKKVSPGKTAKGIGKKYKLSYTGVDKKLFGTLPKSYRFYEKTSLPVSVKTKGRIQYYWLYDKWRWTDGLMGLCGDLKLTPCWMKYQFIKKSDTKTVLRMNLGAQSLTSMHLDLRYSEHKDMKKSKRGYCRELDGDIVLKKLKKGKTYYIQFRAEDFDIDIHTKWSGKIVYKNK